MSTTILVPAGSRELSRLAAKVNGYVGRARSPRTQEAYERQWASFTAWCKKHRLKSMPARPDTVALYLAHLAERGLSLSTFEQTTAAITDAHRKTGHRSPCDKTLVRDAARGIRRVHGTAKRGRKALLPAEMQRILGAFGDSLIDKRDRALLLLGYLGGFRRIELVSIKVKDVIYGPSGMVVRLFATKDDRALVGRDVPIPGGGEHCPVEALRAWIKSGQVDCGHVFRSVDRHGRVGGGLTGRDVARVLKRRATAAGMDATELSGHSLRSGFVTAAHMNGAPLESIVKITGHRSHDVAARYIRKADMFVDHPAAGLLR